jgi:hypothetical protein
VRMPLSLLTVRGLGRVLEVGFDEAWY